MSAGALVLKFNVALVNAGWIVLATGISNHEGRAAVCTMSTTAFTKYGTVR